MPDKRVPVPPQYDPDLAAIIAESARLKRRSAEMLKRIAELDKKIAEQLVGLRREPRRRNGKS